jgi:hypothetical protein
MREGHEEGLGSTGALCVSGNWVRLKSTRPPDGVFWPSEIFRAAGWCPYSWPGRGAGRGVISLGLFPTVCSTGGILPDPLTSGGHSRGRSGAPLRGDYRSAIQVSEDGEVELYRKSPQSVLPGWGSQSCRAT